MGNWVSARRKKTQIPGGVIALFEGVGKTNAGLADSLAAYVVFGENVQVLASIGAPDQALLRREVTGRWNVGIRALRVLVENPSAINAEQWVRLGQVFWCADDPMIMGITASSQVPRWLLALQVCRARAKGGLVWELPFMTEVLTAGEVSAHDHTKVILEAFFAILPVSITWQSAAGDWKGLAGGPAREFVDFVGAHIDQVAPLIVGASAKDGVEIAEWLGYFPELLPGLTSVIDEWVIGSSKTVREACIPLIEALGEPFKDQLLSQALARGKAANLGTVVDYCMRTGEQGRKLLEDALAPGQGGKRDEMLITALRQQEAVEQMPEGDLVIPPRPGLDLSELGADFVDHLKSAMARQAASYAEQAEKHPTRTWVKEMAEKTRALSMKDFEATRDWLNGQGSRPGAAKVIQITHLRGYKLTLMQAVRYCTAERTSSPGPTRILSAWQLDQLFGKEYDWRSLLEAATLAGVSHPLAMIAQMAFGARRTESFHAEDVWPLFAEDPRWLNHGLGLVTHDELSFPKYTPNMIGTALSILAMFPSLPAQYLPVLAQIATTGTKTHRLKAQQMLRSHPNAWSLAANALGDGKAEIRAGAAAWLARIGDPRAVEPLKKALAGEKREAPQASMLNALSVLGEDISAHLTKEVLDGAARKGLAAKAPASMAWFPLDNLPACAWADGTPVADEIIRWWVVLAVKLKDPQGAGLFKVYVSLLDKASRERLGIFMLDAWIAQDTMSPTDEDARSYASAGVDARYDRYQQWAKKWPNTSYYAELGARTKDHVFDELRRERLAVYLGSAVADKGMLSLSVGAPGHHVYTATMRYIKDHGGRRSQVEALVIAAAGNEDPAAIQLVLSVARKHKQETVRLKAAELAEEIAERCGWSLEELADRTIPTAGFDDQGLLSLDYGSRQFTGRISRSAKGFGIALFNQDGKPISALPKPGVADDDTVAGESRKQLTTSKKEITQVVAQQTARLFEAMCLERRWDADVWSEFLLGHPLMRHLVSTLVWRAEESGTYRLFRPTADGDLLDVDDDTVVVPSTATIGLAHGARVTPDEAKAWLAHLEDYQVEPVFSQFGSSGPTTPPGASEINDHLGWFSDTFAIRARATKRGFARGAAEDGGWFSQYVKALPDAKIRVVIEFTGSVLPEELVPAAVQTLSFERDGRALPLADVPPILLAESYADYVFIAEAGAFDPGWETKAGY